MLRLFATLAALCGCASAEPRSATASQPILDLVLTDIDGQPHPLAQHQGKVLLIVNVASKCGFTSQYAGLQKLWAEQKGQGLVVLGVPSNDFGVLGGQEPGTEAEIKTFCTSRYQVDFPLMAKVPVKGPAACALFQRLAADPKGATPSWNFNKYLVGRDGRLRAHFGARTAPDDQALASALRIALAEPKP